MGVMEHVLPLVFLRSALRNRTTCPALLLKLGEARFSDLIIIRFWLCLKLCTVPAHLLEVGVCHGSMFTVIKVDTKMRVGAQSVWRNHPGTRI